MCLQGAGRDCRVDAFKRYQNATDAVLDEETGLLSITTAQFANLKSLFFSINGRVFEFNANAQIWPRALNSLIGGEPDSIYLIVSDIGPGGINSIECINGYSFLERYYSVFDTTNGRIGFATTQFTMADIN
jgi:cathepsin E